MTVSPDRIELQCPHCRFGFAISASSSVALVVCPDCRQEVEVPRFEPIQPVPEKPQSLLKQVEDQAREHVAPPQGPATPDQSQSPPGGPIVDEPLPIPRTASLGHATLPTLPPWHRRFRTWTTQTLMESKWGLIVVVATISVAGVGGWLLWQQSQFRQGEAVVLSAWNDADNLFRQAQFVTARTRYETVVERAEDWGRFGRSHAALARQMQDLCLAAAAVGKVLESGAADPTPPLQELLERGEALKKHPATSSHVVTGPADTDAADRPTGLKFPPEQRWLEVVDWLTKRAERLGLALQQEASPTAKIVEQLEQLATFLSDLGHDVDSLKTACQAARVTAARDALVKQFEAAARQAIEQQKPSAARVAFQLWERLQSEHEGQVDLSKWSRFAEQLRSGLLETSRHSLQVTPADDEATIDTSGPELLKKKSVGTATKPSRFPPVFVIDEDRVQALDATSGQIRFELRRGFVGAELPILAGTPEAPLCVVHWTSGNRERISVLDGLNGETRWTWQLPAEADFRDVPLVEGNSLVIVLRNGQLWQFALATGKLISRLTFPEPLAGPCSLNPSNATLACLGQAQARYLVSLAPRLSLLTLALRDQSIDTAQAGDLISTWSPPFLLVFANRDDTSCQLTVYREEHGELRRVQQLPIQGRVWQSPPVLGDRLFLATDSGHRAILQVSADREQAPVTTTWSLPQAATNSEIRPYQLSTSEAPYILAYRNRVESFFLATGAAATGPRRRPAWAWTFPQKDAVIHQPLQSTSAGIVVAARHPDTSGVLVACLNATTGKLRWSRGLEKAGITTPAPATKPAGNDRLRIGHVAPLEALDPWNATRPLEREVVALLFDRLLQPDKRGQHYVKGPLVASYDIAPGARLASNGAACQAYRLRLATGHRFSDGTAVEADDVVASIRRLSESPVAWHDREQARLLHDPRAVSPSEFEVLLRPYLAQRSLLHLFVAPRKHYASFPARLSRRSRWPVGSGRFVVPEDANRDQLVLKRNPHYGRPGVSPGHFAEIVFQPVKRLQLAEAVTRLENHQLDLIAGLNSTDIASLPAIASGYPIVSLPQHTVAILAFNHRRNPFKTAANRRALMRAFDPKAVLGDVHTGREDVPGPQLTTSPFPPGATSLTLPPPQLSDDLLRRRFTRMKQSTGIGRVLRIKFCGESPLNERVAENISATLNALGLDVAAENLSWNRMQQEVCQQGSFDMAIWFLDYRDPLYNLGGLFDPRLVTAGTPKTNYLGFTNQPFLQLLVDARRALTSEELINTQRKVGQFLQDDAVLVPLWTQPQYAVIGPGLKVPPLKSVELPGPWLFHRINEWQRVPVKKQASGSAGLPVTATHAASPVRRRGDDS